MAPFFVGKMFNKLAMLDNSVDFWPVRMRSHTNGQKH